MLHMKVRINMEQAIEQILNDIKDTAVKKGYWAITSQRIMEITKLKPYVFRNYLLKTRKRINMPEDIDVFCNENPEDLISLLESIYGEEVENAFYKAGVFIPYKNRIEINEVLITIINSILNNHRLIEEDFEAMLYGTETFKEARDIYYDEEFDIDKMIEQTCHQYMDGKEYKLWNLAQNNIINYMKSLFIRNIFVKEALFYSLEKKLRDFAVLKDLFKEKTYKQYNYSYQNDNKKHRGYTTGENKSNDIEKDKARRILNIRGKLNTQILKKRYRELMKIYHPDVNPKGLEKSQQINLAYAILLSEVTS